MDCANFPNTIKDKNSGTSMIYQGYNSNKRNNKSKQLTTNDAKFMQSIEKIKTNIYFDKNISGYSNSQSKSLQFKPGSGFGNYFNTKKNDSKSNNTNQKYNVESNKLQKECDKIVSFFKLIKNRK